MDNLKIGFVSGAAQGEGYDEIEMVVRLPQSSTADRASALLLCHKVAFIFC